jgi:hypothetical protein
MVSRCFCSANRLLCSSTRRAVLLGVQSASVLELEDLLLHVGGLVVLGVASVRLLEVELVQVVAVLSQEFLTVDELNRIDKYLLKALVFTVVLQIGFEVIAVLLLLLSQVVGIDGVGVVPSLVGAVQHPAFAAGVVHGVYVGPGVELGEFPELSVELADDDFSLDEVLVVELSEGFAPG